MPRRSKVAQLPEGLRDELDRRLIESRFSGYVALADWLSDKGYQISHAAVHRHGVALEREIELVRIASEEAKAIEKALEDDGESLAFGILTQCQVKVHQILRAAEEGDAKLVGQLSRSLVDITRAGISLRRERKLGRQEAVKAMEKEAPRVGLSAEGAAQLRAAIEGLK